MTDPAENFRRLGGGLTVPPGLGPAVRAAQERERTTAEEAERFRAAVRDALQPVVDGYARIARALLRLAPVAAEAERRKAERSRALWAHTSHRQRHGRSRR